MGKVGRKERPSSRPLPLLSTRSGALVAELSLAPRALCQI